MGEWGGNEQKNFQQVLAGFEAATGAKITYQSAGDEIATKIGTVDYICTLHPNMRAKLIVQ